MISEMTNKAYPSFDMLCFMAEKTLRSKGRYWCSTDSVLRGRGMEDDIMQDIFIRLIKTTATRFLVRKDRTVKQMPLLLLPVPRLAVS